MKLELTSYKTKYSVETPNDDLHITEYLQFMIGLLIQAGFSETSINEEISKMAEEFNNGVTRI
jgi:hypothetical protein